MSQSKKVNHSIAAIKLVLTTTFCQSSDEVEVLPPKKDRKEKGKK